MLWFIRLDICLGGQKMKVIQNSCVILSVSVKNALDSERWNRGGGEHEGGKMEADT